jgi:hypothetical protein
MNTSATTTQTWEVLKENFPLQAMAAASNFGYTLVAVGGMGHKIHLLVRGAPRLSSTTATYTLTLTLL